MMEYLAPGLLSLVVTIFLTNLLIPRLRKAGITGKDENKLFGPEVPEMGGIAIVAGLSAGVLLAIFFSTFLGVHLDLIVMLAALVAVYMIALIGIVDDLLDMPQWLKAVLPLFAAIPLVAVSAAGSTELLLPFIGTIDFGIVYILVLIPLGIAVASNLTNMLAGFNGMEAGMGSVIFAAISILAISQGSLEMGIMAISMLGALLAFLLFNLYPAKIFPGDVGNLMIGAVLASSVIIGNFESAGAILMVPYALDWFIKAANRFPHTKQSIENGRLYPKDGKIKGLVHLVMRAFNGIEEKRMVVFFIALEAVFATALLILYL